MRIKGISWVGIGTRDFDKTLSFFTDVLGLELAVREDPVAMLEAGPGQVLEVFGEGSRGQALTMPPAIAFEVDDVAQASAELSAAGVEMIGKPGEWGGFTWAYFRGPEGFIFAVKTTPADWAARAKASGS